MPRLANRLEKWLTAELGLVGHNEFRIYRDLRDGNAGEPYEPQLQDAIGEAPLFIAMVSRGYFLNENTRWELKLALDEAEEAPGDRYVQPIYTITGPEMYGDEGLSDDELVLAVKAIMRLGRSNSLHDNVEGNIRYDKEASERLAVAPADTG
jgi:hypothetical protein